MCSLTIQLRTRWPYQFPRNWRRVPFAAVGQNMRWAAMIWDGSLNAVSRGAGITVPSFPYPVSKGVKMICDRYRVALIGMALATLVCVASIPAMASSSDDASAAAKAVSEQSISNIQHALDEQRYVDAGNMLNQVLVDGAQDPRIVLLVGELSLARSNYSDALASFTSI